MREPVVTKEGKEVLDRILNIRPPIIRKELRTKYLRILSLLMTEQGAKEAGKDLVSEAIKTLESKALLPIFHGWEEPDKVKAFSERYRDIEAYYAGPCEVKRWKHPPISKPVKYYLINGIIPGGKMTNRAFSALGSEGKPGLFLRSG